MLWKSFIQKSIAKSGLITIDFDTAIVCRLDRFWNVMIRERRII